MIDPHLSCRTADGKLTAREGPYTLLVQTGKMTVTVQDRKHVRSASVETRLAGSNPAATPQGVDPLAAKANYLLGSDPKQWRTGVPLYQRALYRNVYPGIDLVFHGSSGALEYDFAVRPGANAGPITLELDGADGSLSI